MECFVCGEAVDPDRVDFLLDTGRDITCPKCSSEEPKLVLFEYSGKTAGSAVVVPNDEESKRLAVRCYRRAR